MKQMLILISILLLGANLSAQAPDTLWSKLYGGADINDQTDCFSGADVTYDGNLVLNGYSASWGDYDGDHWLVKIDTEGDTLWTATFGSTYRDYSRNVIETFDSCLVLAGHGRVANSTEKYRIRLFKADSVGNQLWEKDYTNPDGFSVEAAIETADSGFAVVGWTDTRDAFLFKADSAGDSVWAQLYDGGSNDIAYDIVQTDDGGYIIAGSTESYGAGYYDAYIIRTDSNGDTLWTRVYGGTSFDEARAITKTNDGNYMITGFIVVPDSSYQIFLIKIQDDGTILWTKNVGTTVSEMAYDIFATADDGFLIAGRFNSSNANMYLLKVDAAGDTLWSYSHEHAASTSDEARYVHQMNTGEIYLIGTRGVSAPGEWRDYWVVKLDEALDVPHSDNNLFPSSPVLKQNYPNPFNPSTTIEYTLQSRSNVTITLFDILGRKVKTIFDQTMPVGKHSVTWDGTDIDNNMVATGVYFYRIKAGDFVETKKMLLLK
jgi:hypothetical protein